MSNEEYYAEVQSVVDEIVVTVNKQTLQPKDGPRREGGGNKWSKNSGAVYVISVKNREVKEHRESVVTLVPYWLAAKGIVDRIHVVAADDQIREFLKAEAVKREQIQGAAARNRGVAQFTIPPVNDGGSK